MSKFEKMLMIGVGVAGVCWLVVLFYCASNGEANLESRRLDQQIKVVTEKRDQERLMEVEQQLKVLQEQIYPLL